MKIFLIRHGEKQHIDSTKYSDKINVGLTDLGIKQVKTLAKFLSKNYPQFKNFDLIYSSPITRAAQTGQIIKDILKIKNIEFVEILREFVPTKDYSLNASVRERLYLEAFNNRVFDSLSQKVLDFFKSKFNQQTQFLLVSAHGALIRNTIYYLFPKIRPSPDKILDAKIFHGGLTIIDYDGQNFTLEKFNFADYLKKFKTK